VVIQAEIRRLASVMRGTVTECADAARNDEDAGADASPLL